jgi:hypothetical protein
VLKIRTKEGKILSYSFIKEVKEYITEWKIWTGIRHQRKQGQK